jgi:V8-like Glu-specific endopeptidase
MGYATLSNRIIKQVQPRSLGYPGDLDNGEQMYFSVGALFKTAPLTTFFVNHLLDSSGGQTGSPLIRYINGYPFIYAVHTDGFDASNDSKDHNIAVRLTKEKTTLIYNWLRIPVAPPVVP